MVHHTPENAEKLAARIVDDWDMATLLGYATATLTSHYIHNERSFNDDWAEEMEGGDNG